MQDGSQWLMQLGSCVFKNCVILRERQDIVLFQNYLTKTNSCHTGKSLYETLYIYFKQSNDDLDFLVCGRVFKQRAQMKLWNCDKSSCLNDQRIAMLNEIGKTYSLRDEIDKIISLSLHRTNRSCFLAIFC